MLLGQLTTTKILQRFGKTRIKTLGEVIVLPTQGFFMSDNVLLSNFEYDHLYQEGGDALIAFFATLRFHKTGNVFKKKGRSGVAGTLRAHTGLSYRLLNEKNYLKKLIELGYIIVHGNGNVALASRNLTKKLLPRLKYYKLIPISVFKRFTDTKYSSIYVRVHSSVNKQHKAIRKNTERIKILQSAIIDRLCDREKAKELVKIVKRHSDNGCVKQALKSLRQSTRQTETISNRSFAELKNSDHPFEGYRIKKKFESFGLLKSKRRSVLIKKGGVTRTELLAYREHYIKNCFYIRNGSLFMELSSDIQIESVYDNMRSSLLKDKKMEFFMKCLKGYQGKLAALKTNRTTKK